MHSLVLFLTTMGRSRSRLSVESVVVSPGCVCKGGSNLTVISFPGSELDSWTCLCSGMAFSLEYTLGNYGLRHEEGQEVQRTHKDYLPSLKSPPEERTWGKKCLFFVKVTFAEI